MAIGPISLLCGEQMVVVQASSQPAPHGPTAPTQLLSPLVTLGLLFQVVLTWVKQTHQRANCVFQHY